MAVPSVLYPRFVIRTSHACAVVMTVLFVLMILLMAASAASTGRWTRLALPFACAVMSVGFGRRALGQLQVLEQTRSEPDDLMLALFDLAFGVPTLGLLAVIGAVGIY